MSLRDRRRRQQVAITDPIPVKPFLVWFAERISQYQRQGHEDPRPRVLADIGWSDDAGSRRIIRWHSWWVREKKKLRARGDLVARADVEDALATAGVRMWELVASKPGDGTCSQRGSSLPLRGRPRDVLAYIDAALAGRMHTLAPDGTLRCELRQRMLFTQRAEFVEDEPDESRGNCSTCREEVPAGTDGACLWCGDLTDEAKVNLAFAPVQMAVAA